jgi:ProP effector
MSGQEFESMNSTSLKEQLQAIVSQLVEKESKPKQKLNPPVEKAKKPKPKWLDYVQYGAELLRVYFPDSFKPPKEVKPLKKGIKQDLILRLSTIDAIVVEDKACMVKSLAYYVNTGAYHKSMVEGTVRIDLDGHAAGVVSAEEAKYSMLRYQTKTLGKQLNKTVALPAEGQNNS